ncbi:MAG: response regulator, partial [Sulfurimonadaceae bacterium]|nr:response regulator [Sulfurimonadaceae bacterium]
MTELVEKLRKVAGKLSVLIVEDEELIRTQLEHYFERFFAKVTIAVDGQDGLQKFRESGPFDIVISDIRMPNLDGVGMMRIIKEAHPDQKFIIASAHSDSSYFLDLIEMGVFHYIIKPINYTQLMEVLLRLCGQLQLEDELFQYKFNLEELVTEQTRELREQYWTDPTTKLPNRIKLREDLKRRQPQSIAVFNVDNFSKYNATFGTQFGDEVLKSVAESLGG